MCQSHFSANAKLPQRAEYNILPHLPLWHSHFLSDGRTPSLLMCHLWFREDNLKLKPFNCSLLREEITYLAHRISKDGLQPSSSNLEVIAECILPQTYMEVCAFCSLLGHYRMFIKGFACIAQPLSKYLAGEGASRKSVWVLLTEDALRAFKALQQVCMTVPILAFADYTKPFLLETDTSKDGLGGQCCCRSWQTGSTTPSPMAAGPLCLVRRITTQLSSSF